MDAFSLAMQVTLSVYFHGAYEADNHSVGQEIYSFV
jgi:hypothetical protein